MLPYMSIENKLDRSLTRVRHTTTKRRKKPAKRKSSNQFGAKMAMALKPLKP